MKILVDGRVLSSNRLTGVGIYTKELIDSFTKLGINYDLYIPHYKGKLVRHFLEHTLLPVRSSKYDILFCPGNIAPIWKPKKVKLITTIHDLTFLKYPSYYSKTFQLYYALVIPRVAKLSDKILTSSESERKSIIEVFPFAKDKVEVVSCGVSEIFLRNGEVKNYLKSDRYVLYVGSLKPSKNIKGLLEVFIRVLDKIPHNLYIIGETQNIFSKKLGDKHLIREIPPNRIKFFGYVEDNHLSRLYKNADCLIFPSFYEGFGIPLLEAMASGCPIVASNTSSIPEVVGDAAIMVNPLDYNEMATQVVRVVTDKELRTSLIKKGKERAKHFSWENSAKKIYKIFEELL
jgi:glycosyltransferase involved in cell wall biosynthesis